MAAWKPILALTDGNGACQVIDEDEVGWYIPPGDSDKLLETYLKLGPAR